MAPSILDAADTVAIGHRGNPCGLRAFLDSLDDTNLAQMTTIFDRANAIKVGVGRYTYVQNVIANFGGPRLDTQCISLHMRGEDSCQTS